MSLPIGHILVANGDITEAQRACILQEQTRTGRPFGEVAEEHFGIAPERVEQAWAMQYASICDWVNPVSRRPDVVALQALDPRQAWQFGILPMRITDNLATICTTADNLVRAHRFAVRHFGRACYFVLAKPDPFHAAMLSAYPLDGIDDARTEAHSSMQGP